MLQQHTWVVQETVPASDDGVEYKLVKCSACQKEGLMVAATKATVVGTSKTAKDGTCVKLENNGDTMIAKINVAAAKAGYIYLRGCIGHWHTSDDNSGRTFFDGKESIDGNFKLEVNEDVIDYSAKEGVKYSDVITDETADDKNYSPVGDFEVGACSLKAGANTIKFTRLDSYNVTIESFLVIFNS